MDRRAEPLTVVSTPALNSERATIGASSAVNSPLSAAVWIAAPKPPGAKASRCICRCSQARTGSDSATAAAKNAFLGPNALNTKLP